MRMLIREGIRGTGVFRGGRFLSEGRGTCLGAVYVKYTVDPAITDIEQGGEKPSSRVAPPITFGPYDGIGGFFAR